MKARTSAKPSTRDHILTPALRRKLKRPLGRLYSSVEVHGEEFLSLASRSPFVVTVGDRVTETFQETTGRSPDVFVVDGLERRKAREIPQIAHGSTLKAKNPAGRITGSALSAMKKAFEADKPAMVVIDGEEDLLTIPAVIDAPVGAVVLYGQPLEGIVAITVDEAAKAGARATLEAMAR